MNPSPNPSGLCQCGCGKPTPLATHTRPAKGLVKGQPTRFLSGHYLRSPVPAHTPVNPSGVCACGCGKTTRLVKHAKPERGLYVGDHYPFIRGHHWQAVRAQVGDPNPSGLCLCGCGQPTPISKYTDVESRTVRGLPLRYLPGHQGHRSGPVPEGFRYCSVHQGLSPLSDFYPGSTSTRTGICKQCKRNKENQPERWSYNKGRKLKQNFGLSFDTYQSMLKSQNGVCAICKRPETQRHQNGKVKDLAVDHDHLSGQVRALLCYRCNHLLGNAEDGIPRLQSAIRYLRKFSRLPR